jgi:hypothetical protein
VLKSLFGGNVLYRDSVIKPLLHLDQHHISQYRLLRPAKNKAIQTKLNEVEKEACPGVIEGRTRPLKTPGQASGFWKGGKPGTVGVGGWRLLLTAVSQYLVEIVRIRSEGERIEAIAQGGCRLIGEAGREQRLGIDVHGISAIASWIKSSGR